MHHQPKPTLSATTVGDVATCRTAVPVHPKVRAGGAGPLLVQPITMISEHLGLYTHKPGFPDGTWGGTQGVEAMACAAAAGPGGTTGRIMMA